MCDGIPWQKSSITSLTEGLLFFKTYLGQECLDIEFPYKMLYIAFDLSHKGNFSRFSWEINQFKDLNDWKVKFVNETDIWWVIDLQTNALLSKPKQDIRGFKFDLQKPNRKDFEKGKDGQDEYGGACSDSYVQNWAYDFLKEIGEIE